MKLTLVLISFAALIFGVNCYKQFYSSEWNTFKLKHNNTYKSSSEELMRLSIWMKNKETIEEHNKLFESGNVSYSQGINQFSDMTEDELKLFKGLVMEEPKGNYEERVVIRALKDVPDAIDWREHGVITEVKDQGQCGSCSAFSATGAFEGQYAVKTGQLLSFSEQQIVDCSQKNGCHGGYKASAFDYIKQVGGLELEDSYKYTADETNQCQFEVSKVKATDDGFKSVMASEDELRAAVANIGPIAVSVHVADSFQHYKSGVYDELNCGGQTTHAVLIVGYGSENGKDYWLVKNSWVGLNKIFI